MSLLKHKKLQPFMQLTYDIYLDIFKVFYTNLSFDGKNLQTSVKGVNMPITPIVWKFVIDLKYNRVKVGKGNTMEINEFNKMLFYRSCLKDQNISIGRFHVGHLKVTKRFLAYVVA